MLMAKWLDWSWQILQAHPHLLRQSFVSTGFLLAKDGVSEQHLVDVPALRKEGTPYTFMLSPAEEAAEVEAMKKQAAEAEAAAENEDAAEASDLESDSDVECDVNANSFQQDDE